MTAMAIWESLRPNYAWAEQIPKDDPRIKAEFATVLSPEGNGSIRGYLVRPAKDGRKPGVLVVHENRGLNPYIQDVARRLAVEDYIAFAPDGLTSLGGYPGDDEKGGQLFAQVNRLKMIEDFIAAARWLKARQDCTGKIGVVGFCCGGGVANTLAGRMGSELSAAVPFYGGQPPAADVAEIKAPLLLHYAGLDTRVNAGWPAYEEAFKANHVTYTAYIYEGANHGFHNDRRRDMTSTPPSSHGSALWTSLRNISKVDARIILMVAGATSALAQGFHFGITAGVPLTEYFDTGRSGDLHGSREYSAATRRYTAGPAIEFQLTPRFGFETGALFKRIGYVGILTSFNNGVLTTTAFDTKGDSWDIPLMAKYRFGGGVRSFVAAGGVVRYIGPIHGFGEITTQDLVAQTKTTTPIDTSDPTDVRKRWYPGVAFAAGLEFEAGRFRIGPEFRYTRWTANIAGPQGVLRFEPNQAEFLVTFLL